MWDSRENAVTREILASQASRAVRDPRVLPERLVYRAARVVREVLDYQVGRVLEDPLVFKDLSEELVSLVRLERPDLAVHKVSLVMLDSQDYQVPMVNRVHLETLELPVIQVRLDLEAKLDLRVNQVWLDFLGSLARVDRQVTRVKEGLTDNEGDRVRLVIRDHVDLMDLLVSLDHKAPRVGKVQLDCLEMASQVLPVL